MGSRKKKSRAIKKKETKSHISISMSNWSNLQPDLLELVATRLRIRDIIRMNAVCKAWHWVMEERVFPILQKRSQLPCLLFPGSGTNNYGRVCHLYSFTDEKTSSFLMPEHIVDDEHARICGSSYGWLVIVTLIGTNVSLFLLNPLTGKKISTLPPLYRMQNFFPRRTSPYYNLPNKVILSGNPSLDKKHWVVIAMYGNGNLMFARPGDPQWTDIRLVKGHGEDLCDMVMWKEKLYVVGKGSVNLGVCDIMNDSSTPKLKMLELEVPQDHPHRYLTCSYLVVSSSGDDLFLVCRVVKRLDYLYYRTTNFFIYKLCRGEELEGLVWKKMSTIGNTNDIIFLGINHSLCLPALDYPECEANCIYYTDDEWKAHERGKLGGHDVGIFNMVNHQFKSLPGCCRSARFIWPAPLWFAPTLFLL